MMEQSHLGKELARIELEETKADGRWDFNVSGGYVSHDNNIRLGVDLSSDYRLTGTLTHFDTSLPDIDEIEIDEDEWEEFKEVWEDWYPDNYPIWFPGRRDMEELLSVEDTRGEEWEIEFGLSFNLFDSGLREARIEEKEKALKQAKVMKSKAADGVEMKVKSLYSELENAYNQLKQAELEFQFAEQQYSEAKTMVETGLATEQDKKLARLGKIRAENELQGQIFDYELAKLKISSVLGLEIHWFLSSLTLT